MKKTKHIIIAAIAVSVITLGAVVACNKENSATKESTVPSMKSLNNQVLQHRLRTIWHLTDSAYKASPTLFLSAADKEDLSEFLNLTNISYSLINETNQLALLRDTTGKKPSYPVCPDCDAHALSNYVDKYVLLRSIMDSIRVYIPDFVDSNIIMIPNGITPCEYDCIWRYKYHYLDKKGLFMCLENCFMTHHIDDAVKCLEAIREKPLVGELDD